MSQRQTVDALLTSKLNLLKALLTKICDGPPPVSFELLPPYSETAEVWYKPLQEKFHACYKLLARNFKKNKAILRPAVYGGRAKDPSLALDEGKKYRPCLVAYLWHANQVVCAACFRVNIPTGGSVNARAHAQILFLATHEEYRRRGLAQLLVCCIWERARVAGHEALSVVVSGPGSRPFWGFMGFKHHRDPTAAHRAVLNAVARQGEDYAMKCEVWAVTMAEQQGLVTKVDVAVAKVQERALKAAAGGAAPGSAAQRSSCSTSLGGGDSEDATTGDDDDGDGGDNDYASATFRAKRQRRSPGAGRGSGSSSGGDEESEDAGSDSDGGSSGTSEEAGENGYEEEGARGGRAARGARGIGAGRGRGRGAGRGGRVQAADTAAAGGAGCGHRRRSAASAAALAEAAAAVPSSSDSDSASGKGPVFGSADQQQRQQQQRQQCAVKSPKAFVADASPSTPLSANNRKRKRRLAAPGPSGSDLVNQEYAEDGGAVAASPGRGRGRGCGRRGAADAKQPAAKRAALPAAKGARHGASPQGPQQGYASEAEMPLALQYGLKADPRARAAAAPPHQSQPIGPRRDSSFTLQPQQQQQQQQPKWCGGPRVKPEPAGIAMLGTEPQPEDGAQTAPTQGAAAAAPAQPTGVPAAAAPSADRSAPLTRALPLEPGAELAAALAAAPSLSCAREKVCQELLQLVEAHMRHVDAAMLPAARQVQAGHASADETARALATSVDRRIGSQFVAKLAHLRSQLPPPVDPPAAGATTLGPMICSRALVSVLDQEDAGSIKQEIQQPPPLPPPPQQQQAAWVAANSRARDSDRPATALARDAPAEGKREGVEEGHKEGRREGADERPACVGEQQGAAARRRRSRRSSSSRSRERNAHRQQQQQPMQVQPREQQQRQQQQQGRDSERGPRQHGLLHRPSSPPRGSPSVPAHGRRCSPSPGDRGWGNARGGEPRTDHWRSRSPPPRQARPRSRSPPPQPSQQQPAAASGAAGHQLQNGTQRVGPEPRLAGGAVERQQEWQTHLHQVSLGHSYMPAIKDEPGTGQQLPLGPMGPVGLNSNGNGWAGQPPSGQAQQQRQQQQGHQQQRQREQQQQQQQRQWEERQQQERRQREEQELREQGRLDEQVRQQQQEYEEQARGKQRQWEEQERRDEQWRREHQQQQQAQLSRPGTDAGILPATAINTPPSAPQPPQSPAADPRARPAPAQPPPPHAAPKQPSADAAAPPGPQLPQQQPPWQQAQPASSSCSAAASETGDYYRRRQQQLHDAPRDRSQSDERPNSKGPEDGATQREPASGRNRWGAPQPRPGAAAAADAAAGSGRGAGEHDDRPAGLPKAPAPPPQPSSKFGPAPAQSFKEDPATCAVLSLWGSKGSAKPRVPEALAEVVRSRTRMTAALLDGLLAPWLADVAKAALLLAHKLWKGRQVASVDGLVFEVAGGAPPGLHVRVHAGGRPDCVSKWPELVVELHFKAFTDWLKDATGQEFGHLSEWMKWVKAQQDFSEQQRKAAQRGEPLGEQHARVTLRVAPCQLLAPPPDTPAGLQHQWTHAALLDSSAHELLNGSHPMPADALRRGSLPLPGPPRQQPLEPVRHVNGNGSCGSGVPPVAIAPPPPAAGAPNAPRASQGPLALAPSRYGLVQGPSGPMAGQAAPLAPAAAPPNAPAPPAPCAQQQQQQAAALPPWRQNQNQHPPLATGPPHAALAQHPGVPAQPHAASNLHPCQGPPSAYYPGPAPCPHPHAHQHAGQPGLQQPTAVAPPQQQGQQQQDPRSVLPPHLAHGPPGPVGLSGPPGGLSAPSGGPSGPSHSLAAQLRSHLNMLQSGPPAPLPAGLPGPPQAHGGLPQPGPYSAPAPGHGSAPLGHHHHHHLPPPRHDAQHQHQQQQAQRWGPVYNGTHPHHHHHQRPEGQPGPGPPAGNGGHQVQFQPPHAMAAPPPQQPAPMMMAGQQHHQHGW